MRCCISLCLFLSFACSPDGGGRPSRDAGGGGDTGGMDSSLPDAPRRDIGSFDTGGECVADSFTAEESLQPVDIVWVIDNSGSMSEEASLIQEQMNSFVSTITSVGLDVHVVVITAGGFVNVPAPLGTDPSQFLRIAESVGSNEALEILLSTFSSYESFLRRTASLHFIAVTDDESEGLSAASFTSTMTTNLARTFRFHSIVSPPGSRPRSCPPIGPCEGCEGPRGEAAANGDEYWDVSSMTGGRQLSICTPDWTPLFGELSAAIAIPMSLPCVYEMPPPPPGEELNPLEVNIRYTPEGGSEETIPNVGSFDRCTGEGWYYEGDPADPDRILLCPNTCRRLELSSGRIDFAVGCATLLI